ncbi:hypothetical protein Emed_003424 [Eimeria media]
MPFHFGWRRTQASKGGGHRPDAEEGLPKGQGSLVSGAKDVQDESARSGGGSKSVIIRPAPAHAASPVVSLNSKPSLLRKTLSTLSMRSTPKANQGSPVVTGTADAPANGNRSVESATSIKPSEIHAAAEGDSIKKAATGHSFLPRFHASHHQQSHVNASAAHDGLAEHGGQSSHAFHFPHLHLPHILDSKSHHAIPHQDILHGMENRIEVMKVLEEATNRAKKIIENARGERENMMQRARAEAEEEMAELRHSLEQEALAQQGEEAAVAESLRLATLKEDTRTHELLETSQENITASVNLCVVRNDLAARRTAQKPNFMSSEHSWDADPRDFPPAASTTEAQADVYSQILGGRQYSDEDEFRIDFNELENPPPLRQFSTVMQRLQNSCGCFFG